MDKKNEPDVVNPNPDWQDKDIKLKPLIWSIIAVLGVTMLTFIGIWVMIKVYNAHARKIDVPISPLATERTIPEGPLLQVRSRDELYKHQAEERAQLDTMNGSISNRAWPRFRLIGR